MRGTEIAKEIIEEGLNDKFIVYFDPDVDGAFSGVLPWKFLKDKGINSLNLMNKDRQHGMLLDMSPYVNKYKTIISVDAFVSAEKVKELVDMGFNFISLDHHECGSEFIYYKNEKTGKKGVVINNQYPFESPEKVYLSGCGVVYEAFCEMYPDQNFDWFRDLVGITLLSDVRDISYPDSRKYLEYTYNAKDNKYMNYLIDQCTKYKENFGFGRPKMDRSYISYTLSPAINALLRFNMVEEVMNYVTGKSLRVFLNETQKELIKETIEKHIKVKNFKSVAIVQVENWHPNVEISNFIGLIANNLLGKEADCIICFCKKRDGTSRASFRSVAQEFNFLDLFKEAGYNAIGHKAAFGILDFTDTKIPLNRVVEICDKSSNYSLKRNFIEVKNLSMFKSSGRAKKIAEENDFLLDKDKVFIKYLGSEVELQKKTDKYSKYKFDNVTVMLFDELKGDVKDYLIDVSSSSGLVNFIVTTFKE